MRTWRVTFCLSIVLVIAAVHGASSDASTLTYIEDFSTKQYCDTLNTTALWDTATAVLRLPPYTPTYLGDYDTPGFSASVVVSGDLAFLASRTDGLNIFDVRNPASPVWSQQVGPSRRPYSVV